MSEVIISIIIVAIVVGIIATFFSNDNQNQTRIVTPELSKEDQKKEVIRNFFTVNINVDIGDSITEDGVRTKREMILKDTKASLLIDDFTKVRSINVTRVAGEQFSYVPLYTTIGISEIISFFISFGLIGKQFGISIVSGNENYNLSTDETIYFLFEGGQTIEYTFEFQATKWDETGTLINTIPVSIDQFKLFVVNKLDKWRIDKRGSVGLCVGDLTKNKTFYDRNEVQFIIREMAKQIILTAKESL